MPLPPFAPIPYDEIDPEIRRLIYLLNQIPGIKTLHSCAGHTPGEICYVTLQVDRPIGLQFLVKAMPFWMMRCGFKENRGYSQYIYALLNDDLTYNLHLEGYPLFAKRDLIEEVEQSLSAALESPPPRASK